MSFVLRSAHIVKAEGMIKIHFPSTFCSSIDVYGVKSGFIPLRIIAPIFSITLSTLSTPTTTPLSSTPTYISPPFVLANAITSFLKSSLTIDFNSTLLLSLKFKISASFRYIRYIRLYRYCITNTKNYQHQLLINQK